jgi:putative spermidine/putrescine transport system permease protein
MGGSLESRNRPLTADAAARGAGRPSPRGERMTKDTPVRRRSKTPLKPWALVLPAVLFLVAFFVLPLLGNGARSIAGNDGGFTISRYVLLLADGFYLRIAAETLVLSAGVTSICVVIGYPAAYFLVRRSGRWAGLIIFLLIAPLLTSIIMRTFGWQVLFARRGLVNNLLVDHLGLIATPLRFTNSPGIAVAALVHVLVPFMVLSIGTVLQSVDPRLEESAKILGAGRFRTLWEVTLPLSLDGVGTGAILVFMMANGSFVTLVLLGGGLQTLPLMIYQQFNTTRDFGMASAMSTVLLVIAVVCLFLQLRLVRRRGS